MSALLRIPYARAIIKDKSVYGRKCPTCREIIYPRRGDSDASHGYTRHFIATHAEQVTTT